MTFLDLNKDPEPTAMLLSSGIHIMCLRFKYRKIIYLTTTCMIAAFPKLSTRYTQSAVHVRTVCAKSTALWRWQTVSTLYVVIKPQQIPHGSDLISIRSAFCPGHRTQDIPLTWSSYDLYDIIGNTGMSAWSLYPIGWPDPYFVSATYIRFCTAHDLQ